MMRTCTDNSTHSSASSSLPLLPPFDLHSHFSLPFHPTLCLPPLIPTTTSPPLQPLPSSSENGFDPAAGTLAGDSNSGEGGDMGFVLADDIDFGLVSCTESLGFESSDEISSLHYGSSNDSSSSSSSSSSASFCWYSSSSSMKRRSENREFPPPLTTMSENGRRNFVLRSERRDGRLEIVKVAIERPEVLYASRQNGRLTMHLVRSVPESEEDDDAFEEEDEETEEEGETEDQEEEEREWRIPAAGVRRCYQHHGQVWGQQQRRWVTTM